MNLFREFSQLLVRTEEKGTVRSIWIFGIVICLLSLLACKKSAQTQPTAVKTAGADSVPSPASNTNQNPLTTSPGAQPRAKIDACSLLTSAEIQSIQGEPVKDSKLSGRADGGFIVSQCFFGLPTFANSVSLSLTQRGDGKDARDPREFWKETFEQRREEKDKAAEPEEEGGAPPQKIGGLGQEAVWIGSRVGGAMYVLKGNSFIRLSVGGAGDQTTKIKKCRSLAEKVLPRI